MKKPIVACAAIASAALLFSQSARGAQSNWQNLGTDFNTAGNWSAGVPSGNNVGVFAGVASVQPNVSASISTAGLLFSITSSGYDVTSTNAAVLTLTATATSNSGSGGSNSTTAALSALNTSGSNTIDVALLLSPASGTQSTFQQAAGGTLIINSAISSAAGINLSLRGGGTVALNNASNSFTTASIDTAGETLVIGADTALGAGALSVNSAATLQAGGGARSIANNITLGGNTTLSGSNAFTFGGTVTSSGSNSRTLTVSNTGGTTFNGNLYLSDSNTLARSLTIGGTSSVVVNGVITNNNVGNTLSSSLTYNGSGMLTLNNSNTYGGGSFFSSGAVVASHDGALGTGNVTLSGASVILTLQNGATNNYISDAGNVNIQFGTASINLNFTGTDVVNSLTIAGASLAPGIYGNGVGGTPITQLTGMGTLTVLTQIPEPATYMLMGIGILVCAQQFRRKKG